MAYFIFVTKIYLSRYKISQIPSLQVKLSTILLHTKQVGITEFTGGIQEWEVYRWVTDIGRAIYGICIYFRFLRTLPTYAVSPLPA